MNTKYLLIITGIVMLAMVAGLASAEPQYKGTAGCRMCHTGMHKPIVEGYAKVAHLKAMQKADAEGAIVGDFSSNKAFTKDKVAYTLGKGRSEQAYLDAQFNVLPAVWDVKTKTWKETPAVDGSTQCVGCHSTGYDVEKKAFVEPGVGCEACHGPGSEHAAKPNKENAPTLTKLSSKQKGMVCGSCHSAGKDTTGKFAFPVKFRPGDDLTKSFVDAKPTGPGRNQEYSEHLQSKHGQMGLACTACHDAHNAAGQPKQLKKPVTEQCLTCHATKIKDIKTHQPAAPADATCATCHMPNGQHTFKKLGG